MTKKAILFDLDGTLVNSLDDITNILNYTLEKFSPSAQLPLNRIQVKKMIGRGVRNLVDEALKLLETENASEQKLEEMEEHFRHNYRENLVVCTRCYDGVVEVLKQLTADNVTLGIVTNKPGEMARIIADKLMPGFFKVVLGPDDVKVTKPDPAMIFRAEELLQASSVALVGDSAIDVASAKNVGIKCVAVTWGLGENEDLFGSHVIRVDTPEQLLIECQKLLRIRMHPGASKF